MDLYGEVVEATERIKGFVRVTPCEFSPELSELTGARVYLKLENLQYTGSFKLRGALNKLLSLTDEQRSMGVVTASTGNHGAAFAYACKRLGVEGTIFVPRGSEKFKLEKIKRLGGKFEFHGKDPVESERHAREYASAKGMTYLSPYNDPLVVAGQGTVAHELTSQLDRVDALFVALGGGGLAGGMGGYMKHLSPDTRLIGCSPENSPVMIRSIEAGRILDIPVKPTLSDGTAGGVEEESVTFEICKRYIDRFVTVTEREIAESIVLFLRLHRMAIEGAAAVPLAAFLKTKGSYVDRNVVIVICGGNISYELLKKLVCNF